MGPDNGSGGSHNTLSLLLVSLLALSLCGMMWWARLLWVSLLLGFGAVFHWRRFMNATRDHFGLGRVPVNVLLKVLMLLICATASIVALVRLPFRRPPGA